jgi:hypothetical protein
MPRSGVKERLQAGPILIEDKQQAHPEPASLLDSRDGGDGGGQVISADRLGPQFAQHLPERTKMMQQWADLTDEMTKSKEKVTPIKRAVA